MVFNIPPLIFLPYFLASAFSLESWQSFISLLMIMLRGDLSLCSSVKTDHLNHQSKSQIYIIINSETKANFPWKMSTLKNKGGKIEEEI